MTSETEKEKQILTGEQRHTDHIDNGQRVSRHSFADPMFYFFHRIFLKQFSATPQMAHLALPTQSQPFAKPKRIAFFPTPTEIRILVNYILTIN